jgi:hypothetical protein
MDTKNQTPRKKVRTKSEFSPKVLEIIYDLAREYGKEDRSVFIKEIKSLIRYDRLQTKNTVLRTLQQVL